MNVDLLHNIYGKSLFENEKNILFWENYLRNLKSLDLNVFSEKLTVPVLVPIGSRIMFRGELKHTNEVTVALGADYFAKCSVDQAKILKQHRIKDAQSKLELLQKERDYLKNQLSFSKKTTYDNAGYDILEVVSDEEHKIWQQQHQKNMRQYKQSKKKSDQVSSITEMSNEDLWNRLDELELQEELENELRMDESIKQTSTGSSSTAKADNDKDSDDDDDDDDVDYSDEEDEDEEDDDDISDNMNHAKVVNEVYLANYSNRRKIFQQPSKLHLFEQVVDRHKALKEMVAEMRARQKNAVTEEDLVARLDDMERLEQLEDEIAILEDMLGADDDDDDIKDAAGEDVKNQPKKSVAFADEDDSETFELTFKHSEVEPCSAPYDPQNGITKPSDIVNVYSSFFSNETTSILKKPKCDFSPTTSKFVSILNEKQETQDEINQDLNINNTIIVKDVVEKVDCNDNNVNHNRRPMSLFKKKRQQLKE